MKQKDNRVISKIYEEIISWTAPVVPTSIPHGDMPGDKVNIGKIHIYKANVIFPELLKRLKLYFMEHNNQKVVLSICGGSGVGKSEIASLLSYYLGQIGIESYTLSGDNYPHRIPKYNDAERLHMFRESGLQGMVKEGALNADRFKIIHKLQLDKEDANHKHIQEYPWLATYIEAGRKGLSNYLGTNKEIGFDEVEAIITQFKSGEDKIWLKRMGRKDTELWYEEVDFSDIDVIIIEWTHGNSDYFEGVDIPILLNSTPQETLDHRRSRNRDRATDSAFTMMVLDIEQNMLKAQAHKAKIILSKSGELITYDQYKELMKQNKGDFHE